MAAFGTGVWAGRRLSAYAIAIQSRAQSWCGLAGRGAQVKLPRLGATSKAARLRCLVCRANLSNGRSRTCGATICVAVWRRWRARIAYRLARAERNLIMAREVAEREALAQADLAIRARVHWAHGVLSHGVGEPKINAKEPGTA